MHVLLAHLVPPLLLRAQPAPLDHIHLLAQLHAQPALPALLPRLLERHQKEIAFAPLVIPEEVVMHVLWESISLTQAQQIAHLALLDTQPLRQEVSLPHLVVSVLLAILAL